MGNTNQFSGPRYVWLLAFMEVGRLSSKFVLNVEVFSSFKRGIINGQEAKWNQQLRKKKLHFTISIADIIVKPIAVLFRFIPTAHESSSSKGSWTKQPIRLLAVVQSHSGSGFKLVTSAQLTERYTLTGQADPGPAVKQEERKSLQCSNIGGFWRR